MLLVRHVVIVPGGMSFLEICGGGIGFGRLTYFLVSVDLLRGHLFHA